MELKFAVTKVLRDNRMVLKVFDKDDKDGAMSYGKEVAKTNNEGIIDCVQAYFSDEGKLCDYGYRIFEVWESNEILLRRSKSKSIK